jgi:hypothetical protein
MEVVKPREVSREGRFGVRWEANKDERKRWEEEGRERGRNSTEFMGWN